MHTVSTESAQRAVRVLLEWCGYDPDASGLMDTPRRVVTALAEMTAGQAIDPGVYLSRVFDSDGMDADEMIVLRDVPFSSLCEHHMLPFVGTACVAYIPAPGAAIVGISKLARVVDAYTRRLTVQERATSQIAAAIDKYLTNVGVAVTLASTHQCMTLRGVRKHSSVMVTSKLTGLFRDDPRARSEFFELART